MAKGITKELRVAEKAVLKEIRDNAAHSRIAAGLSTEGYAGGYHAALQDVQQALRGIGNYNSRFWPSPYEKV